MPPMQINTRLRKPLSNRDALVAACVIHAGKNRVFGEIDIAADDAKIACRASTTHALL